MAHTPEVEGRIQLMMADMRALKWRRGESSGEYAERYGIALSTAEENAAEAWKRVKAEVLDPVSVGATVGAAIEKVMADALADTENPPMIQQGERVWTESPNQSRKVVIEAAKVWAMIAGATAPTKREHSGPGGGPIAYANIDLSKLTDAQLEALRVTGDASSLDTSDAFAEGGSGAREPTPEEGETPPDSESR